MGSPDDPVTWSTRSEAEPVAGPAAAAAAAGGAPGPGRAGSSSLRARAPQPRPPRERAGAAAPGGAWRRAGVKWAETMSFVAEAAEGVGARGTGCGGPQGARMAGEGRAASGATVLSRQPSRATRTRIESYEIQIIKNDNGKKGERRPFLREEKRPSRPSHIPQIRQERKQGHRRQDGVRRPVTRGAPWRPRRLARVLSLSCTPTCCSARREPSPSERQRGRQPTKPVGLRGSPQAAPLPRSTCASPAASLLQSKQTPNPEVTSLPPPWPRPRPVSAALRGR